MKKDFKRTLLIAVILAVAIAMSAGVHGNSVNAEEVLDSLLFNPEALMHVMNRAILRIGLFLVAVITFAFLAIGKATGRSAQLFAGMFWTAAVLLWALLYFSICVNLLS